MIKNYKRFLNKIEKLKLYLVEFNKDSIIKNKIDLLDCIIDYKNYWVVIIITYNKYIIFTNNNIYKD